MSPDPISKAAALMDSLIHNHLFADGNKRTECGGHLPADHLIDKPTNSDIHRR